MIEPADAEISGPQQFTLTGISMLHPGCVRWSVSPSTFPIFSAEGGSRPVDFAKDTGRLGVSNLPNDVTLSIHAIVADKVVASTSVRYYDPAHALDGVFSEVGVLRCPDHVEQPREDIQEIISGNGLKVTFIAIETYVDYHGAVGVSRDPLDPRRGSVSITVDEAISAVVPDTLDLEGTYYARPDGHVELRDVWLGPDVAQCGHVLERREALLP